MGSGRTLRKHSHTRPVKTPAEKRRRCNAQRARLVKFGMDEAVVKKDVIASFKSIGERWQRERDLGHARCCYPRGVIGDQAVAAVAARTLTP